MKQFVVDTDLYWTLPGPRDFIARVAACASRSRILCLNLPLDLVPGTWEGVRKGLEDAHIDKVQELIIRGGTDIAADVGVHFGQSRVTAEQVASIMADQPSAIILRSIGEEARANCERYAHEFMGAIGEVKGNISLVIGFSEIGMRRDAYDSGIQIIVFDGGLTRDEMDAYVALRMLNRRGPGSTSLTRHIVSEFAGNDVDFAEKLMRLTEDQIVRVIEHLPAMMSDDSERWRTRSWLHRTESVSMSTGAHVLHDRFLMDNAATQEEKNEARKRIEKRYWMACVNALTPWLEERRLQVIGYFNEGLLQIAKENDGKIPRPQGKDKQGNERIVHTDMDELEYNNIVGMCAKGILSATTQEQMNALSICKTAKAVRDNVAHLRMPDPEDVIELVRKMDLLVS